MNSKLQESIKNLYKVFTPYIIVDNLRDRCCSCCVTDEEIKALLSKPLTELMEEDICHFMTSALTTFGNLEDYKHFLPRILELITVSDLLSDFEVFEKLNYANWKLWKEVEVLTIKTFFHEFLVSTLKARKVLFPDLADTINVCGRYLGIKLVLKELERHVSDKFLKFIVDFKLEATYLFLEEEYLISFNKWLTQSFILGKLEVLFLKAENRLEANRISIVYTLLENEKEYNESRTKRKSISSFNR
ncbi:hypothetical protein [Tenacibaculum halocynthiae]|uniref:hypothetical protein n=1 Tax=Tenacibaculum halocynthiae TaxID=1254437 RepID=UPI003D64AECE